MALSNSAAKNLRPTFALMLVSKRYWLMLTAIVAGISIAGLAYLGTATYRGAPPVAGFVLPSGQAVISRDLIKRGETVFRLRGLMSYGSFWGDGAERGPDFTADALHRTVLAMRAFYETSITKAGASVSQHDRDGIAVRVTREIHENTWDETSNTIVINDAQAYAFEQLYEHYTRMFTDPTYPELFQTGYITEPEDIRALAAYFFWGGWVAGANRPGKDFSYTHNWPYDPDAGNHPTLATWVWSFVSILVLFAGIMAVLYVYGQLKAMPGKPFDNAGGATALTTHDLENGHVRPTQRVTYGFFALAMILFGIQVLAGIVSATDFVRPFGLFLGSVIPFTVTRSFHTLGQIMWFFMCWVGYTIFFLPRLSQVPRGQRALVKLLLVLSVVAIPASFVGIYLGQTGLITGALAYWFGSQGWEFMEFGRAFQIAVLFAFVLWIAIIYRGVRPWLTKRNVWSVPAWLLYGSGIMVAFLFFGLLVTPETNFAVADYWRWMVVHMWVEVTFEVFTTVIVAYLLVQMGLVTRVMAERVIFIAVMLFLITAVIGISHNFYWIAKPTGIIALGSVFSTMQVLPLLLLTLDAWAMRQEKGRAAESLAQGKQKYMMDGVWLFILAVNFWNIFGAGVFGSLINLPIVNYYEHGTYMTGNHAHAAMFGVKGNVALAGMLFCCQHLFRKTSWNPKLIRTVFWSLNIGVAMMMFLDLFPVGLYQLTVVLEDGYWFARSQAIVTGPVFRALTYARSLGGAVFVFGGLLPLIWFVLSRGFRLRPEVEVSEGDWTLAGNQWAPRRMPPAPAE
ncbi:MAG: cbb3-type cytochrome c oxidase subunit I [Alphaproteobacteria bacterium]